MSLFFAETFNIDIDHHKYREQGTSKAKRLRCFLRKEDSEIVVRVLNGLWDYRETRRSLTRADEDVPNAHAQLLNLMKRLDGRPAATTAVPQPPSAFDTSSYAVLLGELFALGRLEPQTRGYEFERFLNRLFAAFGLAPRSPFRTVGEQIDGSFMLGDQTYLLEAKWQNDRTPAADLFAFKGKLSARMTWARGLFVSYTGFSGDGLIAYGRGGNVICMDGLDLSEALQREIPFQHVLQHKVRRSVETGEVLARVSDLFSGKGHR